MIFRTRLSKTEIKTFPDRMDIDGDEPVIVLTEESLKGLIRKFWADNTANKVSDSIVDPVIDQWLASQLKEATDDQA